MAGFWNPKIGRFGLLCGLPLLAAALALGGCSIPLSDMPLIGSSEPEAKPKPADEFPAVNDLPRGRDTALEPSERARIENELVAARERQAAAAAAKAAAAK